MPVRRSDSLNALLAAISVPALLLASACTTPAAPAPAASTAAAQPATPPAATPATTATSTSTATPASTGSSGASGTTSAAAAPAKVSANNATAAQLQAAFEAAKIPNAANWVREVQEYRPYPTNDPTLAKLRQNLVKYNPAPGVVDAIVATLSLP